MNIYYFIKKAWKEDSNLTNIGPVVLMINDFFGGKIMNCMIDSINYYFNIVNDKVIDLTSNMFKGLNINYDMGKEVSRESLLSNYLIKNDYYQLLKTVYDNVSMYMFMSINSDELIDRPALDNIAFFSTFEIENYYDCEEYERITFDLAAQNTGNLYCYRYYKKENIYVLEKKPILFSTINENYEIPTHILDQIFTVARNKKEDFQTLEILRKKINFIEKDIILNKTINTRNK